MSASTSSPTDDQPDIKDNPAEQEDEFPRSFLESKLWFAAFAVVGVIVAITAVILLTRADSASQGFAYTELVPPRETLDFSLTNHRGENFTLSDHAGETTILTFLYTSCTDVCPFIGAKLRQTLDLLGDDAEGVNVVAITLDPERDSPERAADYSRSLRMFDDWHYLLGEAFRLLVHLANLSGDLLDARRYLFGRGCGLFRLRRCADDGLVHLLAVLHHGGG